MAAIEYEIINTTDGLEACYYANTSDKTGLWQNRQIPFTLYLPTFVMQLTCVLLINQLVVAILKPLRQPPIVGQVLAGILLGQSIVYDTKIFPYRTLMELETFSSLNVVFYMFLVGLDMDVSLILASRTKVISIALAGILIPMTVGIGLLLLAVDESQDIIKEGYILCAVALTSTNYPELTRILTDLRILHLDIGRTALSSSLLSDLLTWMLFLVCISAPNPSKYYEMLSTVSFIIFCVIVICPALSWIFRRTIKDNNLSDTHIWFVLAGILLCGFITDGCGAHSAIGAFTVGVIMPKKHRISNTFKDRLGDFIFATGMPCFFLLTGLRSNLFLLFSRTSWIFVLVFLFGSTMGKIVSTFLISLLYKIPPKEGLALGLLMNTKGVLALVILNSSRKKQVLDNKAFTLTILALLLMTCLIEPVLIAIYKETNRFVKYKCRTIQRMNQKAEFRILACIHSRCNISGMINLMEVSNATDRSAIHVFAVHLMELTRHTTPLLIMNNGCKSPGINNYSSPVQAVEAEEFVKAFDNYEKKRNAVIVETLTSVSPYKSMHQDICSLAKDKRVAFIIIPYQRPSTTNDEIGNANATAFAGVNLNVLENTPCSVGIFVDRGLGSTEDREPQLKDHGIQHLCMLFIGGPDDREALAYAWRMSGHPKVKLTVVRFLPGKDVTRVLPQEQYDEVENMEKNTDDEDIYEFKFKTMNDGSISYLEGMVNNGEEAVAAIRELCDNCDLYIVGRREGVESPLTSGMSDSTNFPDLGVMGYMLVTSNFASHASVLIVQRYINRKNASKSELATPDLSIRHYFMPIANQISKDGYDEDEDDDDEDDDDDDD